MSDLSWFLSQPMNPSWYFLSPLQLQSDREALVGSLPDRVNPLQMSV